MCFYKAMAGRMTDGCCVSKVGRRERTWDAGAGIGTENMTLIRWELVRGLLLSTT